MDDEYIPNGLGIGDGDYVEFAVDLDTGMILNWNKRLDLNAVKTFIDEYKVVD